ncbi:MAG TPA: arginine--tRNA ligase, partial [Ignavibacteriales bacterium]|nr:arginine--tRNA ligase [Ignavibacteriales bacterium]
MKKYLAELFNSAAEQLAYLKDINITFNAPALLEHGDLATNAAMILTKTLKRNPRAIAEEIISNLKIDKDAIEKIEIAGPGFINFYFTMKFKSSIIREIINEGDNYGKSDKYKGKKAMVEFVSANPTGPLTVGHGRNAVYGDTVA